MSVHPPLQAPDGVPFPHAKRSKALLAEDDFYQMHGGRGSQALYRLVDLASCAVERPIRSTASLKRAGELLLKPLRFLLLRRE
ncbi:hypothetical protein [Notoacmeibacter marinus]|uniref:hypothetical protein n=1 Tax=Notoacmeibacter marinus TaxID=1876515 RepID=UPI000DF36542|nr:hypothetical protein [Notoacmeibacter marinus]